MHPIPSAQRSTIISLLHEHYSVCEIQFQTGIGKSTIGRIKKELHMNKENSKGGCPSKLSPHDKQSIIRQITTGKLNNAVQAAHVTILGLVGPLFFISLAPSFLINPSRSPFLLIPTDLYLSIALIR